MFSFKEIINVFHDKNLRYLIIDFITKIQPVKNYIINTFVRSLQTF